MKTLFLIAVFVILAALEIGLIVRLKARQDETAHEVMMLKGRLNEMEAGMYRKVSKASPDIAERKITVHPTASLKPHPSKLMITCPTCGLKIWQRNPMCVYLHGDGKSPGNPLKAPQK